MAREYKIVIGANLGDEGKGLCSGALAEIAAKKKQSILTVFFNGTTQRLHSYGDHLFRAGSPCELFGGKTYYHSKFVVDPIALLASNATPYINPSCRIIIPSDVVKNQENENARGADRHGSCGQGLFECVKRNRTHPFTIKDLQNTTSIVDALTKVDPASLEVKHELYNITNFIQGCQWILKNCKIATFEELEPQFDVIIFEGGQGLMLDQSNKRDFPHLTPSSTGSANIAPLINSYEGNIEVYYVSRTYITRHGAGPLEKECTKEKINPEIVDKVNQTNNWQGALRFGFITPEKLYGRIQNDLRNYTKPVSPRLLLTQMNYTNSRFATGPNQFSSIDKPAFIDKIFGSWDKENIEEIL